MARRKNQPLTRERILAAALRMADEEGIEELSIRKLGARLGVNGVSLYHHFGSKTEIVDGLVAHVMTEVDLASDEDDWEHRLRRIHCSLRDALVAHPNLLPAAVTRPFNTRAAMRVYDAVLETLLDAGFGDEDALHGFQTLRSYVVGHALSETVGLLADPPTWVNRERMTVQEYGEHGFHNVLRVVPAAAVADNALSFSVGLDSIIVGLETRLADARSAGSVDREAAHPHRAERLRRVT